MVNFVGGQECVPKWYLAGRDSAYCKEKSAGVYRETSGRSQSHPSRYASKSQELLSTPLPASAKCMSPLKGHGLESIPNTTEAKRRICYTITRESETSVTGNREGCICKKMDIVPVGLSES